MVPLSMLTLLPFASPADAAGVASVVFFAIYPPAILPFALTVPPLILTVLPFASAFAAASALRSAAEALVPVV